MRNQRRPLPEFPKCSVRCETWVTDSRCIFIDYLGHPEELLAAGAIEPLMVHAGTRGVHRFDSHGDSFSRQMSAKGRLKVLRYVTDLNQALSLPGVWVDQDKWFRGSETLPVCSPHDQCPATPSRERRRAIGRFQRQVVWVSVGDLIIPDWQRISMERYFRDVG